MNYKIAKQIISFCLGNNRNLLIKGRPGIGKSEIIESISKDLGFEFIISHPVVQDPTDYKGMPCVIGDEAKFIPFNDLNKLINATEDTVFFLDDLGQASPSVQAACMQLILAREVNGHKISDKVRFIAATNRKKDKAGVGTFLQPLKSRFTIIELEPDIQGWIDWALGAGMPLELIGAVKYRPQWITEYEPTKDISNVPTPRNIVEIGKFMLDGMPRELLSHAATGRIGVGAASELNAFLGLIDSMPSASDIKINPSTADIPREPSCQYVLTGMLVGHSTPETFSAFCEYITRFDGEYRTLFTTLISEKHPDLCNTEDFIKLNNII